MIRAVYRDGVIQPLDEVPAQWVEGKQLEIRELQEATINHEFDDWLEGNCPMSDSVLAEAEHRLAALHALGPTEFEPGEEQQIENLMDEMDEIGRRQMHQLGEQQP